MGLRWHAEIQAALTDQLADRFSLSEPLNSDLKSTSVWYLDGLECQKRCSRAALAVTRSTFGTLGKILIIPQTPVKIPPHFLLFNDAFRIQRPASSPAPSLARIKLFV